VTQTTTTDAAQPAMPESGPDPAAAATADGATPAEPASEPTTRRPVDAPREEPAIRNPRTPLFDEGASGDLRTRWTDVQAKFVDEPRSAVEQADALVGEVMDRLADTFARERQTLEGQWTRGEDVTTEDLRLALQRYRSFFDRLLSL
jgi:hypothetical protein